MFLAKLYMKQFDSICLQAYGDATSTCVRVAENISRFGYATFTKIETKTTTIDHKAKGQGPSRKLKRARLYIEMARSEDFQKLTEFMPEKMDEHDD